jgi:hypothetical protein
VFDSQFALSSNNLSSTYVEDGMMRTSASNEEGERWAS